MIYNAIRRSVPLALGLTLAAVSAQADIGKYHYACKVITIHDRQGYVAARADSLEEAEGLASRAEEATTRLDTHEPVKEVEQCVQLPQGRFKDADFQSWVDNSMPR